MPRAHTFLSSGVKRGFARSGSIVGRERRQGKRSRRTVEKKNNGPAWGPLNSNLPLLPSHLPLQILGPPVCVAMAVWSSDPVFPGWSSLYVIDAKPVVGLTAMPKSSYRSRLPLHATPLSHTPPKWMVGVAATCVNLLPATFALRFWARYTDHAAVAG